MRIDSGEHGWFEDRADPCTLRVFIDDASGRLTQLLFLRSEGVFSYFAVLQGYLEAHGRPVAFYSDRHSVFRVAKRDAKGGQGVTQFGRTLAGPDVEILCADSSQAKGRVERVNRTLQGRLVKELAHGRDPATLPPATRSCRASWSASTPPASPSPPARPNDRHRPLNVAPDRLRAILCR